MDDYLGRHSDAVLLVPFQHVALWYGELGLRVTDAGRRARIVYATNLPNWNPSSTSTAAGTALMQSYYASVRDAGLSPSPRSLMGFLTQRLLANIVERIPSMLTQATFLSTLYAVSVVVLDADAYSIGPLSSAACVGGVGAGSTCETNVGARRVEVRSLDAALGSPSSVASERVGLLTFSSGAIDYRALPVATSDSINVVVAVVASIASVLGVMIVVMLLVFCFCLGRSHAHAPKDSTVKFSLVFTDIQSSTRLWVEDPEEMG
eukprot:GILJ01019479.1.p2 GENE.GILJ01019479.1~~GILJ01019479.1.p2  ORF type:complete len:307 (-),score=24.27 GILJ01019479.1:1433-2221(-)